jgi:hypothetical protein
MTNISFYSLRNPKLWLALAMVVALVIVLARVMPLGPDYYYTFRPIAERFLRGQTRLYDSHSYGLYSAPWSLALIIPLTFFSVPLGQAVLNVTSLLCILLAIHTLREPEQLPVVFVALAIINLHTFDLIIRGNLDAFMLAGVGLSWMAFQRKNPWLLSLGFWLMSSKPVNVALAGLLFLFAMRRWPFKDWLKASSLLLISFGISLFVNGPDWPLRYVNTYKADPPYTFLIVTVWRAAGALHLPIALIVAVCGVALAAWGYAVWKIGLTQLTLSLALATNLIVTPYALGYHYVLLVPAFLYIARRRPVWALLAYAATWTPLLRLRFGFGITWIDVVYPLILLAALWLIGWKDVFTRPAAKTNTITPQVVL